VFSLSDIPLADRGAAWDARDASSITVAGSGVSAWEDQWFGQILSQPSGAAQPLFGGYSCGNATAIRFDGVFSLLSGNVASCPEFIAACKNQQNVPMSLYALCKSNNHILRSSIQELFVVYSGTQNLKLQSRVNITLSPPAQAGGARTASTTRSKNVSPLGGVDDPFTVGAGFNASGGGVEIDSLGVQDSTGATDTTQMTTLGSVNVSYRNPIDISMLLCVIGEEWMPHSTGGEKIVGMMAHMAAVSDILGPSNPYQNGPPQNGAPSDTYSFAGVPGVRLGLGLGMGLGTGLGMGLGMGLGVEAPDN
jgi:hypothetical protein